MEHPDIKHPHDMLARHFLCDPERMAEFLQLYLKNLDDQQMIALLDLTRLVCRDPVTVSNRLVEGRGDLRFATSFKGSDRESNVYLLFEHQSRKDSDICLRGLDHIVQDYKNSGQQRRDVRNFHILFWCACITEARRGITCRKWMI